MGQPSIRDTSEADAIARARSLFAAPQGASPRRLVAAGMVGVLLLALFFMSGTFTAISFIDNASVSAEVSRATAAVELTADPDRLARDYGLTGARVTTSDRLASGEVSVPLPNSGAVLAWMPRRFATEAFNSVAPMRLGLGVLVIACVGFVMLRLHALARDLEARRLFAHEMACRDPLTGLRNRLTFDQELRDAFTGRTSRSPGLALFYLDLDGFKSVNDTLGHYAGDQLLRLVGERLSATVGPNDTIARLGGDEFAIIRREALSRGALDALAFCIEVALTTPFVIEGDTTKVGVSIGIARTPADALTASDLVRAADRALYRAKADGGSRFAFADDAGADADAATVAAFAESRRAA